MVVSAESLVVGAPGALQVAAAGGHSNSGEANRDVCELNANRVRLRVGDADVTLCGRVANMPDADVPRAVRQIVQPEEASLVGEDLAVSAVTETPL